MTRRPKLRDTRCRPQQGTLIDENMHKISPDLIVSKKLLINSKLQINKRNKGKLNIHSTIKYIKEARKCFKKITNHNIESKEKFNMLFCVFSPTLPLTPPKNTEVVKSCWINYTISNVMKYLQGTFLHFSSMLLHQTDKQMHFCFVFLK